MAVNKSPQTQTPGTPPPMNIEQTLQDICGDYILTQITIKKCIVVLSDQTCGLMSRDFIATVGDKMKKNHMINLQGFLAKLNEIDKSLNKALYYLKWLKNHTVELINFEDELQENTMYNNIEMGNRLDGPVSRMLDKRIVAIKGLAISPICGAIVGGVGGAVVGGGVVAALITIVGILSVIGVAGVAAAGVGALATGAAVGLIGGVIIGVGIWLKKAYDIGKNRKAKYSQIEEIDEEINNKEVSVRLSVINSNLQRTIELVKDANNPNYNFEMSFKTDEADRDRAVLAYKDTYQEIMEMGRDFPENPRIEMAKKAARNACKAALAKDPIYNSDNMIDTFIHEKVNTGRERENSRLFPADTPIDEAADPDEQVASDK